MLRSHIAMMSITCAIKELLQNSVDAGATKVVISLNLFTWSMSVVDNGCGIAKPDFPYIGCLNHTSKITKLEDLETIFTYGFRGEALYNIQKVSKVQIISKTASAAECWSRLENGRIELTDSNMVLKDPGTKVIVRDFFYNLPVRRKIHRNRQVSAIYHDLRNAVFEVLIMFPNLDIKVTTAGQKNVFSTFLHSVPKDSSICRTERLVHRFNDVFGTKIQTVDVTNASANYKEYSVEGIISTLYLPTKDYQFIFINGRRLIDPELLRSIDAALTVAKFNCMQNFTSRHSFSDVTRLCEGNPVIILNAKCPSAVTDLLQSSSKEVFCSAQAKILSSLIHKILICYFAAEDKNPIQPGKGLSTQNNSMNSIISETYQIPSKHSFSESLMPQKRIRRCLNGLISPKLKITLNSALPVKKSKVDILNRVGKAKRNLLKTNYASLELISKMQPSTLTEKNIVRFNPSTLKIERAQLFKGRVINQIDKKFILLRTTETLMEKNFVLLLIDQHAADERIKLEEMLIEYIFHSVGTTSTCGISFDITFEVADSDGQLFDKYMGQFQIWGISLTVKYIGKNMATIHVKSLPKELEERAKSQEGFVKRTLLQHLYELMTLKKSPVEHPNHQGENLERGSFKWWRYLNSVPTALLDTLKSRACRSAIMFGDDLTHDECVLLVASLAKCHKPFECAHGRPSIIPLAEMKNDWSPSTSLDYSAYKDYNLDS